MKLPFHLTLALGLFSGALSLPSNRIVNEIANKPEGWFQSSSKPSPDKLLNFKIGLRQPRLMTLQSKLEEFYDPERVQTSVETFRSEEIGEYLEPNKADFEKVSKWLKENGVDFSFDRLGAWMKVKMNLKKAEELFDTQFFEFKNEDDGHKITRALQYSLPRDLSRSIDTVTGAIGFQSLKAQASTVSQKPMPQGWTPETSSISAQVQSSSSSDTPSACNINATTVQCFRELYGTVDYKPAARKENTVGIGSFLEEYANYQDFKDFTKSQRKDAYAANYTFDFVSVNGGLNEQSEPGLEADLDTQMVGGMGFPILFTDYSTPGRPPFIPDDSGSENDSEPYSDFLSYLLSLPDSKLPSVLTMSYGDSEDTVPRNYAHKVCSQISALVARRVTVISSSGDFGVGRAASNGSCASNGNGPVKAGTQRFRPQFPCTCPWVTCVGATENFSPEVAVSDKIAGFYSGGGFSDFFKVPLWQIKATSSYLKKLGPKNKGLFDPFGRGVPDISAQGSNVVTRINGTFTLVYGTSASAPIVASIVSQLNDARLAKGLPSLGYLNPLIYGKWSRGQALNDVISGDNAGCNTTGFPVEKGWDPVTGNGTPNFLNLLKTVT